MTFDETDLHAAALDGAIDAEPLARLLAFLHQRHANKPARATEGPRFDVAHLLWYAGALIVMTAMGLFSTLAFSQMGGEALAITAVVYAALFGVAGHMLWARGLRTPGGLLIAVAVSMAPLAVYGIQDGLGMWGQFGKPGTVQGFYVWIKGSWIFMEAAAILAAVIALRFYPVPYIVLIAGVALWFMSMDLAPWIAGSEFDDWETRRKLSIWFGLGTLVLAWAVDRRRRGDFAFWLHLFGMLAFWGAVTATSSGTMLDKALYCAMNVVLLFLAVFLGRKVYAVFGVIGIALYLGDLASKVFKDSLLFPFALSAIGVAVIAAGLVYFRNQDKIGAWLDATIPDAIKRFRPAHVA